MLTFADYIQHLENSGKTAAARTYRDVFASFARRLGKRVEDITPEDVNPVMVEEYIAKLPPNTANTFLYATKGYVSFLKKSAVKRDDYIEYSMLFDRLSLIRPKKVRRYLYRKALTIEEVKQLLAIIEDPLLHSATVVLFYLGCRPVEISQPFEIGEINFNEMGKNREPRSIVDIENKIIALVTAKTRAERILPLHPAVTPYFEHFFSNHDKVLGCRRPSLWYTRKIRYVIDRVKAKGSSIPDVTAKTARYTLETIMKMRLLGADVILEKLRDSSDYSTVMQLLSRINLDDQWMIDTWLGHTTDIPSVYTDYVLLIDELRRSFVPKHYMLEVLEV